MQNNTRTENSIKNIAFSLGSQVITLILSFISRNIFLYCLSVDYLGIQGLFSDVLSMLSLADLGLGTVMTYSMYKPLTEKDYNTLAGLTTFYKKIYHIIAFCVIAIGIAVIPFLNYLVNVDTEIPYLTTYYLLYLANTVASYLVVYRTCIVSADQKGYILKKIETILGIIKTIIMAVFLIITRNYIVYLSIQVIFTYLINIYSSHIAVKMYPYIEDRVILPKAQTKSIITNIKSAFLYKISSVLLNATDNTLISVICGTAMVGYYSNYSLVVSTLLGFASTLFYSLTASLGNLIYTENDAKRYEIFEIMQSVSSMLSIFCVTCVLFLQQDFILVWLGKEYQLDDLIVHAIAINFFFSMVLLPVWVFRDATGLYRKTRFVMLGTAAINLVVSILMGKAIGLAGIIFATSIARLTTYFWYEPKLLFKNYFGKSCLMYFVNIVKSVVIMLLICFVVFVASNWIGVTGWGSLLFKGIIVASVTWMLLIVFFRKAEGTKLLLAKLNRMRKDLENKLSR